MTIIIIAIIFVVVWASLLFSRKAKAKEFVFILRIVFIIVAVLLLLYYIGRV